MVKECGLFIDVGNTSIKIGIGDKQSIITSYIVSTSNSYNADVLGIQLLQFIQNIKDTIKSDLTIEVCIVSSVVPSIDKVIIYICSCFLRLQPFFVHKEIQVPLVNQYEKPEEVGADRLVAAYGARVLFPEHKAIVIVDYGTATTFDCILEDAYLGGLICPGIMSSLEALFTCTELLPCVKLTKIEDMPMIGKNTSLSLQYGFFYTFSSMTDGIYKRLCKLLPEPVFFIATGGFALDIKNHTSSINTVYPDLILEGLRFLWILEKE